MIPQITGSELKFAIPQANYADFIRIADYIGFLNFLRNIPVIGICLVMMTCLIRKITWDPYGLDVQYFLLIPTSGKFRRNLPKLKKVYVIRNPVVMWVKFASFPNSASVM